MADLTKAIQAATEALMTWEPESDENRPMQAAKVMVTAAAPHLHADLQRRLQQLEKANAGLYRQEMAKELRTLRKRADRLQALRTAIWEALPTIWNHAAEHADALGRIATLVRDDAALDLAAEATPEVGDG